MARTKQQKAEPTKRQPIDMDRLFRPYTSLQLGTQRIWLRILSDPELRTRDLAALHASRKTTKALNNEESMEYQSLIAPLQEASRSELITTLKQIRSMYISMEVAQESIPLYQPVPEEVDAAGNTKPDITGDKRRETEEKRDAEWDAVQKDRQEKLDKRLAEYEQELEAKTDETLLEECVQWQRTMQANVTYNRESMDQTIYLACFKDKDFQERFFDNIDDARNIAPTIKQKLEQRYREVDSFDEWELKN
jgi:hypothetical protein